MAPPAAGIAEQRVVLFDERLAREVPERICEDLGGSASDEERPDVERMRSFLTSRLR